MCDDVTTSSAATGSSSNARNDSAWARTSATMSLVDRLPTRSQTTFGGNPNKKLS
jgi:hypothetical protein